MIFTNGKNEKDEYGNNKVISNIADSTYYYITTPKAKYIKFSCSGDFTETQSGTVLDSKIYIYDIYIINYSYNLLNLFL